MIPGWKEDGGDAKATHLAVVQLITSLSIPLMHLLREAL